MDVIQRNDFELFERELRSGSTSQFFFLKIKVFPSFRLRGTPCKGTLERTRGVATLGHCWSICFGTSELLHLFYLQVSEYPRVGDIEVYQSNQERNDAYGYEILGAYRYGRKCS